MNVASLEWYDVVLRLAVAAALGGVIGLERGATGHEAGLRTHLLVAVGSGLFATASVGAFDGFVTSRSDTNVNVDVTRIAAYVAPGIGFIGAGVIVKNVRDGAPVVLGLTTAASLWGAAAIGVASGLGFWVGAVATAAIALVALAVIRPLSAALESRTSRRSPVRLVVAADMDRSTAADHLERLRLAVADLDITSVKITDDPVRDRARVVSEVLVRSQVDLAELALDLERCPGTESVDVTFSRSGS